MTKKKLALILILVPCSPVIIVAMLQLLNIFNIANDASHRLTCRNELNAIWYAIDLYRQDNNGVFPPTLLEVSTYLPERYRPGPGRSPSCIGNRGDDETTVSWEYSYIAPSANNGIVPVCWDSQPHRCKGGLLSDMLRWNVLYSDGHVEYTRNGESIRRLAVSASEESGVGISNKSFDGSIQDLGKQITPGTSRE
jgi:hypothetical protein